MEVRILFTINNRFTDSKDDIIQSTKQAGIANL